MSEEFLKQEIADIQHQLANDPTLESCCQRDLEDQLRIAQFKAQLAPQDRSQTRQKLANAIVKTAFEEDDLRQDDDDDDDDGELKALRALRIQELQREARLKKSLESEGAGTVTTTRQNNVEKTIRESIVDHIVCHFYVEGDERGQSIDQSLEKLASTWQGTRFLRCPVRPADTFSCRFGLPPGPGIVCFLQETIVAACSLLDLGCNDDDDGEQEEEAAVVQWLQKRKFLRSNVSATTATTVHNDDNNDHNDNDDDDNDEWQAPCEECGRRYPHQHIRSVYRNLIVDSDDDNGDNDT